MTATQYDTVTDRETEPKVKGATLAGAGSAAILTPALVQLVDELFYGGGPINVPVAYIGVIGLVVTGGCAFAGGWLSRHVQRGPTALAGQMSQSSEPAIDSDQIVAALRTARVIATELENKS